MVIRDIALLNFRNYQELHLQFSEKINIFLGKNGQGKSNLAEGIYFLCHLDSFRTSRHKNLIQFDQLFGYIQSSIDRNNFPYKSRIEISKKGRKVWLNDSQIAKLSDYVSNFYAIVFNPDNLHFYRHFPNERRTFFNRYLSFFDKQYLQGIRDFRNVHAQKNSLLKNREISSLEDWNALFIERSCVIIKSRRDAVNEINHLLPEVFSDLTGKKEQLQLTYYPSLEGDQESIRQQLEQVRESEIRAGHALHGPHRDDFRLSLNGQQDDYFSQGEYRISLLALKLAVNALLGQKSGFHPVMILDDLFSELDNTVKDNLKNTLRSLNNQIFITSTELVDGFDSSESRIMEIREGSIQ